MAEILVEKSKRSGFLFADLLKRLIHQAELVVTSFKYPVSIGTSTLSISRLLARSPIYRVTTVCGVAAADHIGLSWTPHWATGTVLPVLLEQGRE